MNQRTEEATIVFHVGVNGGWKALGIELITIRLVVLLVPRIINQQSIRSGRLSNDNAIHCVSLMLGSFLIAITDMMKVAEGEYVYPSAFVMANTMDKKEGRSQVT
jgi:hypothetical protein